MNYSGSVIVFYLVILVALAVYGFHRSHLVYLYYKHRARKPQAAGTFADLPAVTVQLPLFNEMYVAERLLESVVGIRYPRDRFQIQVLDDSTDETQEICRRKVAELRTRFPDLDVEYIHRAQRGGFKAGALENGLKTSKGELILIFDADFLPQADILERTVDHFVDPRVAVVQCRWEHINRDFSSLTEAQALMLDGHFIMEHAGRNRSGRFFNFNGTAGIWRRSAIADAGGWQHDTLTEDMDLSYRAQLRGWRFVYLPEIAAPAELPVEMSAFKSQQFRWAKGSIQVAMKLLPKILRSNATFAQKSEAFFHLTNNFAYPLLLLLSILLLPNLVLRTTHGIREVLIIDLPLFFGTTLSIASFYLFSQREIARLAPAGTRIRSSWSTLRRLPLVMSIGIGLCVNQTRAVFEAMLRRETEFVRTPKHGIRGKLEQWSSKKYRAGRSITPLIEVGMAAYFGVAMYAAIDHGHYLSMPFLALFLFGFGYVGTLSLWQGEVGFALRRAWAGVFGTRTMVVAPPPFHQVLAASPASAGIESNGLGAGTRHPLARRDRASRRHRGLTLSARGLRCLTPSPLARYQVPVSKVQRWLVGGCLVFLSQVATVATSDRVQAAPAAKAATSKKVDLEKKAHVAFVAGKYEEAISILAGLFNEFRDPVYVRNIGRCYQRLKDPDRAIASFEEYLHWAKNLTPAEKAEVQAFIQEMEDLKRKRGTPQAAAAPAPAAAPAKEAPPPPPPPPLVQPSPAPLPSPPAGGVAQPPSAETSVGASQPTQILNTSVPSPAPSGSKMSGGRIAGIALVGVAAVAAGAAIWARASAWSTYNSAKSDGCPFSTGCESRADKVTSRTHLSAALMVGAAVSAVAGTTLFLLNPPAPSGGNATDMGFVVSARRTF